MRITLLLLLMTQAPLLAVSPEQMALANRHFDLGLYQQAVAEYTAALPAADSQAQRAEIIYRLAATQSKLADFAAANPALDLAHLKTVRFDFDRSKRGVIALDDVGVAPAG